ncbi:MAG: hypothetical protein ACI4ND_01225 [Succinivibrio sp.]
MSIIKFILLTASMLLCLSVCAQGQVYSENIFINSKAKKRSAPNTIAGTKKAAKEGDYVLLKGHFVKQVDEVIFEFADDSSQALFVTFEGVKIPDDLSSNYEYFLWGQIIRNDKTTILQALFLSDKRFKL